MHHLMSSEKRDATGKLSFDRFCKLQYCDIIHVYNAMAISSNHSKFQHGVKSEEKQITTNK